MHINKDSAQKETGKGIVVTNIIGRFLHSLKSQCI